MCHAHGGSLAQRADHVLSLCLPLDTGLWLQQEAHLPHLVAKRGQSLAEPWGAGLAG